MTNYIKVYLEREMQFMKKNNFIPIYIYAKKHGIPKQTIYRWIREGKIKPENVKEIEKIVKRKVIKDE